VHYSSTTTTSGDENKYNLAFDCWVVNDDWIGVTANPTKQNILAEIMVWEQGVGIGGYETKVGENLSLDGYRYDLWKATGNSGGITWSYLAFVPVNNLNSTNRIVNLLEFIDYLIQNEYLNSMDYLSNLSFGNEINLGEGKTVIDYYSAAILTTQINSFHEDFNDGDFTENPSWNLTQGGVSCWAPGTREIVNKEFHVIDMDSPGCGHSTMIDFEMNMPVGDQTTIEFDVNPVYCDVRNGAGDTHEEYPCEVQLELYDQYDNLLRLWFCYNYRGGSSHNESDYIRVTFPDIPQNKWQRDQAFRIRKYFPQAVKLRKLYIGANGWDYEAYFDNIEIKVP
jgi:hypothetical protein